EKQAGTGDIHPGDTAGEKSGNHFLHAGTIHEVIDTEKSNNEGIENRPDPGDGCIIHMAIVLATSNITKKQHIAATDCLGTQLLAIITSFQWSSWIAPRGASIRRIKSLHWRS